MYLVEAPPPYTWTQSPAGRDANQGGIAEDHEQTDGDSQFHHTAGCHQGQGEQLQTDQGFLATECNMVNSEPGWNLTSVKFLANHIAQIGDLSEISNLLSIFDTYDPAANKVSYCHNV